MLSLEEGTCLFPATHRVWKEFVLGMLLPLVFDNLRSEHCHRKSIVVVSPLIALMEDQVASYSAKGLKSAFITSES